MHGKYLQVTSLNFFAPPPGIGRLEPGPPALKVRDANHSAIPAPTVNA